MLSLGHDRLFRPECIARMSTHPRSKSNSTRARRKRALKAHRDSVLYEENVVNALIENRGLLNPAALALGVTREQLRNYVAKNALVAAAHAEAREAMGDLAEGRLFDLIDSGDVRCIMYYLTTVHRKRGYGREVPETAEHRHTHVHTINVVGIPNGTYIDDPDAPPVIDVTNEVLTPEEAEHVDLFS
jgi:hypothetical protein